MRNLQQLKVESKQLKAKKEKIEQVLEEFNA